jgi:GNAT superfamily N-acetyltransferase
MFTEPALRQQGVATAILKDLESWAAELGYKKCILETGKRQTEAINLYLKNQYQPMPNYGQYTGVENSLCFEKLLK